MSTIVTRTGKGTALTWAEADANFTNLNTDKLEVSSITSATNKATPVDADVFPLVDSVGGLLNKVTWVNIKATFYTALGALLAAGTSKATPVDGDVLLLSDSAASNSTKNLSWANLKATMFNSLGALINSGTSKTTPVDADAFAIMDSAASNATKSLTWANLKATILAAISVGRQAPNFANSSAMVARRPTAGTLSTSRVIGQCDNIGMWASAGAVSAGTITQITSAISGTTGYAARAAGVTLTGSAVLSQSIRMEARDAVKYKNKTCSFSVKVDHDVGANVNYTLVVSKPTVSDNFTSRTTIATSSATAVATATGTTLTFNGVSVGDCSNGLELEVQAACGAVTTKNFNVTEFSIDAASSAQTYVAPEFNVELARCQRYLPAISGRGYLSGYCWSTTGGYVPIPFDVTARVKPTGIVTSTVGNWAAWDAGSVGKAVTALTIYANGCGLNSGMVSFTVASGLVAGNGTVFGANNDTDYIYFTGCEL